ncbi:uncharacterized protein LOC124158470 isoform X2 [Ischnura elegans]|uniref:uncharacterized protein LOC124158470 isoform X2 n=1 Tax=Ischnura elegans TaxID=197161 RepID=UPI001ED89DC2|nr:uncharacterized protein LOC124158470 isoform X2 [Ischnura elegans]
MVSPSKKGKLKSKVRDSEAGQSRPSTTGHCILRRGSKPLVGKKFYLDVKNHVLSSRLEGNLKSLGAGIEVFLVKEVDIVVSDRPEWTQDGKGAGCSGAGGSGINGPQSGCGSLTPRFSSLSTPAGGTGSESPATVDSPREAVGKRRVKTRAEAMLVSARQQKQQTTIDPLENARSWKIPIWPVENVFKWIKKIQGSLLLRRPENRGRPGRPSNKFKELRTPFVKLETLDVVSKPSVSKKLPEPQEKEPEDRKDESSSSTGSPSKEEPKRMTRKGRPGRPPKEGLRPAAGAAGYCEICRGDYSDLGKHLKTESHAKFAGNEKNFVSLDKLISKGPNVDGFLKMNGVKNCSELFGTRRSTRSGVNIHRAWSIDNSLSIWKPDDKDDMQDTNEKKDECEKDDVPRRMLVPNGHHNNIQKNLDNHFMQSPKRSRLRLSVDERVTKYGRKDQNVEVVCNGFPESLSLSPVLKPTIKAEPDSSVRKTTPNAKESLSGQQTKDTGHHLRSRLVPTSEDNANPLELQPRNRRCRSQAEENLDLGDVLLNSANKDSSENMRSSGRLCLDSGCQLASSPLVGNSKVGVVVRRKRLSVEERLLEDNKGQYGKELIPAKLRSSGYFTVKKETQDESASASSAPMPVVDTSENKNDPGCNGTVPETENVVKPKRTKRTELSLLSVEAESFMFGETASRDAENCVPSGVVKSERLGPVVELRDFRLVNKGSKGEAFNQNFKTGIAKERKDLGMLTDVRFKCETPHCDGSSLACDDNDGGNHSDDCIHRRKRRTHAEVFMNDNLDYYKFEISDQRLPCGEAGDGGEGEVGQGLSDLPFVEGVKGKEGNSPVIQGENCESNSVKDSEEICKTVAADEVKSVKFSFESIPFSEPWYQTYQRQDEGEEIHFTSFSESSPLAPFLLPSDSHVDIMGKFGLKRSGYQRKRTAGGKNARKSPRCHASTLAIMSSLMAKRRKDGKLLKTPTPEKALVVQVPVPPSSDFKSESDKDLRDIAKKIEVMLDVEWKDDDQTEESSPADLQPEKPVTVQLDDVELELKHLIGEEELINYAVNDAVPDVVSLLDSFPDCECVDISEEEKSAINEAYERGIQEMSEKSVSAVVTKVKGSPGRPRKQRIIEEVEENKDNLDCDSASESVSTCGTVSEVGSHSCVISRKKKRRNRTGWPRQIPKKRKVEFTVAGEVASGSEQTSDPPLLYVPVTPRRRGRPRKYPPKESQTPPSKVESNPSSASDDKDLHKVIKKSTRQSSKDLVLPCASGSEKISEGPAPKESCKVMVAENIKSNSSPNYSFKSECASNNRLTMSSPEGGMKKFSPLGRRSKLLNANRRESPRKVKPQPGTKWDVWSIRKRK